ncbi:MAG: hypothetical protein KDG54_15130, partial [Geminicoccaceae bacterium]|nr:hypothetical protein [Geminicoccaceae bacterium]
MRRDSYSRVAERLQPHIKPAAGNVTIINRGDGGASGDYLPLDGTGTMSGNIDVGGNNITNVNLVDGVDISAHVANADAHHARQHSILSSDHTVTGNALDIIGLTTTDTLGKLVPSSAPGAASAILKSSSTGNLTLPTVTATTKMTTPTIDTASGNLALSPASGTVAVSSTLQVPTIDTASGDLTLSPVGNVVVDGSTLAGDSWNVTAAGVATLPQVITPLITSATNVDLVINPGGTGAVQFPNDQTIRTSTFDSSFPITGFQISETAITNQSQITIGAALMDELRARVFVADETRVDRGNEYWTKSYGILAEGFTTPGTIGGTVSITFEDSPALTGALFSNNDWLLFQSLEIDTGIALFSIWGQVATYVDNANGTQSWTFTLRSGPTNETIRTGQAGIDFGASGDALIHLSTVDPNGAPYIKMRKWIGANPYTPGNYTTYVQIGELGSVSNPDYTPSGYGMYIRSTNAANQFIVADDNGLRLQNTDIALYNSGTQTVNIDYTGTDIWVGNSSTDKVLSWDGSELSLLANNSPVITLDTAGNSYFAGIMTIGTSGEIRQGTGTLGSNYTGLRIWQSSDVGLIGGYSSNTLQWYADTDGKLYAGGGGVAIDALGLHVSNNNTSEGIKMYTSDSFADDTYRASWWWTLSGAVNPINYLYAGKSTAWGDASNLWGRWNLSAGRSGTSDTVTLTVDGSTDKITADAATLDVTGSITVSGNVDGVDIAAFKSAYDSHTHSYLPLSGGTLTGTLTTRNIVADLHNSRTIGLPTVYYSDIYVTNLHTDTIVGTPSYAHSHAAYVAKAGDTMAAGLTMAFDNFQMITLDRTVNANVDNTFFIGVSYLTDASDDFAFFGKSNGLQVYNDGTVKADGHTIWHDGNDGDGSGLDADLLDGNHASAFALASHTHSYLPLSGGEMSGSIVFSGAQTVDGVDVSAFKTAYDSHNHDSRYYTEAEITSLLTGYLKTDGTVAGATSQAQVFSSGVNVTTAKRYYIDGAQVVYLPGGDFIGSMFVGDGGSSLSYISGNDGRYNSGVGALSLYSNTTGAYNSGVGAQSLYTNTTGT